MRLTNRSTGRRTRTALRRLATGTALVTAAALGIGQAPALGAARPAGAATTAATDTAFDPDAAQQLRQDQCLMSTVLREGGPAMKQVAATGLDGSADQLHAAAAADYWDTTPLSTAYSTDNGAASTLMDQLADRHTVWEKPLAGLPEPLQGFSSDADFHWAPQPDFFDSVGLGPWLSQRFWTEDDSFYNDPTPLAGPASVTAATALGNSLYPEPTDGNDPNFEREYNEWRAWSDMTFMHGLFADDTRLLLEDGGFPRTAPDPGTVEFRVAVEDLKTRFASCEYRNPVDPDGVLGQEVQTASEEWQAEIAGQQTQRDAILAANAKATAALTAGAQAMGEALGQSWLADHLTRWQAYWLPGGPGTFGTGAITFQLKSGTSLCLNDTGGATANNSPVEANTCSSSTAQQWRPGSGNVLDGPLTNGTSGKCLYVTGTKVQQYTCNGSAAEHWQYTSTQGQTRLYNVGSKLCLNFGTATKGTQPTMVACGTAAAQQFVAKQNNAGTGTGTDSLGYPTAAEFTQAKNAVPVAQAAAKAQLTIAQQQSAIAQQAATDTTTAQNQAYAVADAAGEPRGRGLLAAQQEAQVTKASAAALQAIAAATATAYQATTASAADSATLQAQAQTQAAASKAAFRLAAADEADAQAKAAAAGAALQAKDAEQQNQTAQAALVTAQQAEATAKTAADTAHAKRLAAEAEQATAAKNKNEAAADEAQAAQDQSTADQDDQAAQTALAAAQSAQATAAQKSSAAQQADQAASDARQQAWEAEQDKNAQQAKARAADAYADAEASSADATDSRTAANQADQDAANATGAANAASAAADAADQAAQAADAAATRAEAAAGRAQSDADGAASAKAIADAALRTDEAAAATAIQAATQSSTDAAAAKKDAADAAADAKTADQDAIAAQADAQQAQASAATTAGYAYTTAQAASAAAEAAQQVAAPANDAIQLGAPYVDSDSSAGLAVLTAQASKTVADQQQAMAQAKSDQAQQTATQAAAVAAAATGDAKAAQVAAADAAAQSAQAQVSAAAALVSAAKAEKAAAQAQATVAQTTAYDEQAAADSAAAQSAADAAAGDATDARASANAAESDAAAADAAASDAQTAASTAREVAAQADADATAAEAAAKDAEAQAASAQQAATQAEQEQNSDAVTNGGATGTPGVFTRVKITPLGDPTPDNDCVLGLGNSGCDVTFSVHFTLTVDFYLCNLQADDASSSVGASGCPAADSTYLGSQSQEVTEKVTRHFSNWFIVSNVDKAFIEGLWAGIKSDFEHCSLTSLSGFGDCLQAGAWVLPVGKVLDAYKLVMALNDALKAGVGISDAWSALKLSKLLDASTLANLQEVVDAQVNFGALADTLAAEGKLMPGTIPADVPKGLMDGYRPYGSLTAAQFVQEFWDTSADTWNWAKAAPDNGVVLGSESSAVPKVGDLWDRFGQTGGKYLSPKGIPYAQRGLPPSNLTQGYHVYKWVKAWDPALGDIEQSTVAPAFGQPGYGVQFRIPVSVQELIDEGFLVAVN